MRLGGSAATFWFLAIACTLESGVESYNGRHAKQDPASHRRTARQGGQAVPGSREGSGRITITPSSFNKGRGRGSLSGRRGGVRRVDKDSSGSGRGGGGTCRQGELYGDVSRALEMHEKKRGTIKALCLRDDVRRKGAGRCPQ